MKRYLATFSLALCMVLASGEQRVLAGPPAQQCVAAAKDLQQTFDRSILKGWQLRFYARGDGCDVLHVEAPANLEKRSLEALAHGTMVYRKVLPGGVNNYAFSHGFKDVVYANARNATSIHFGPRKLDKAQVRMLRKCTDTASGKNKDK